MSVRVSIVEGTLGPRGEADAGPADGGDGGAAGALLVFEGVVRRDEEGRAIAGLAYMAYEPMASAELAALAERVARTFRLISLDVTHSRGFVPVGGVSLRVVARAAHRQEALAAMGAFIDELKRDVPIWKSAVERQP